MKSLLMSHKSFAFAQCLAGSGNGEIINETHGIFTLTYIINCLKFQAK